MADIQAFLTAVEKAVAANGMTLIPERTMLFFEIKNSDGRESNQSWSVQYLLAGDAGALAPQAAKNAAEHFTERTVEDGARAIAENRALREQLATMQVALAQREDAA